MGFNSSRSSEPVSRPTARRSPHKSPSPLTGAQLGGARWDDWRMGCHLPRAAQCRGRCASSPGAAVAAQPTERSRAAAALRPTCHQAQRLARRSSRCEHLPEEQSLRAPGADDLSTQSSPSSSTTRSRAPWMVDQSAARSRRMTPGAMPRPDPSTSVTIEYGTGEGGGAGRPAKSLVSGAKTGSAEGRSSRGLHCRSSDRGTGSLSTEAHRCNALAPPAPV